MFSKKYVLVISTFFILLSNQLISYELVFRSIESINDSTKRAEILILDDNGDPINNIAPSDIIVLENNIDKKVISLKCPEKVKSEPLSTVLTIDASGSMLNNRGFEIAKSAARAWGEALFSYNENSELAITTFNYYNFLITDFLSSVYWINYYITSINTCCSVFNDYCCGTDYNKGFLSDNGNPNGGLNVASSGKYKKILVFLSDGMPNFIPETNKIIDFARENDITVFCVTLGFAMPELLKRIATSTGGDYFQNITNKEDAVRAYKSILKQSINVEPCVIEWESDLRCGRLSVSIPDYALNKSLNFIEPNDSLIPKLKYSSDVINFGNVDQDFRKDTTLKFYALVDSIRIDSIRFIHPDFSIKDGGIEETLFYLQTIVLN